MTRSSRVLFVGLDAADAGLIEAWADAGLLPNFARLRASAVSMDLANSLETLPGAIWPEIHSGISAGRIPLYFHPRQLRSGDDDVHRVGRDEIDADTFFWVQAARAGRKVAVIDIPQATIAGGIDGPQLIDWGSHDMAFETASSPPDLLRDVTAKYGEHPVSDCDGHGRSAEGYERLINDLLDGVRRKRELLSEVLARDNWDLFACGLSESHCVGHQFWHFHDAGHPWHDERAPQSFVNAIRDVYRELDITVGRLIDEAGEGANVVVLASHGMGIYHRAYATLPEFLDRLGMSSSGASTLRREIQPRYLTRRFPRWTLRFLRALSAMPAVRRTRRAVGGLRRPLESATVRAVALENNRCGAIRLNLVGREPNGAVAPGGDAARVVDEIRAELMQLRDAKSGEAIVERVVTAAEVFGENHHPDVPDIMVVFRTDIGLVDRVVSDRIGEIAVPPQDPGCPRSGDHTPRSNLWLDLSDRSTIGTVGGANVLDIAPTVLRLLGVEPTTEMDGVSLVA